MPKQKRVKTNYPGVSFIKGIGIDGKPERIYMIRYRKVGKLIEEKAGRARQNDMTPAKASKIRAARISGAQSNQEKRETEEQKKLNDAGKWTILKLWDAYKTNNPDLKGIVTDENRFQNYVKPTFGEKEAKKIIPLDVDRIRLKLLKKLSPATVRNVLELFRRIVNFGVKKNLCDGLSFIIEMP